MTQAKLFEKSSASVMAKVTNDERGLSVKFSGTRGPSNIGPDGSHVSSYLLFHKIAESLCEKRSLHAAIKNMMGLIDSYVKTAARDIPEVFELYRAELNKKSFSKQQLGEIYEHNKTAFGEEIATQILDSLKLTEKMKLEVFLQRLLETHETLRGKLEGTTYPTEGNVPQTSDEGARAKKAAAFFESLPTFSYQDESMEGEQVEKKQEKEESQDDTMQTAEELRLQKEEIVRAMQNLFWHPKIPEHILIDIEKIKGQATWMGIMAKDRLGKAKYKKGTKPRSNDTGILAEAIVTHLDLIFTFCPILELIRKDLITSFVDSVLNDSEGNAVNYGWNFGDGEKYFEVRGVIDEKMRIIDILNSTFKERSSNSSGTSDVSKAADFDDSGANFSFSGATMPASPTAPGSLSGIPASPILKVQSGSDSEDLEQRFTDRTNLSDSDFIVDDSSTPIAPRTVETRKSGAQVQAAFFPSEPQEGKKRKQPETQDNKDESQSKKQTQVQKKS